MDSDSDSDSTDSGVEIEIEIHPFDTGATTVEKRGAWLERREQFLHAYLRSLWSPSPADRMNCPDCKKNRSAWRYAWCKCVECDYCARRCAQCTAKRHNDAHLKYHPIECYDGCKARWGADTRPDRWLDGRKDQTKTGRAD